MPATAGEWPGERLQHAGASGGGAHHHVATCVLYFYDTSRNGTRRWCSMQGCGGRAKASRHYARTRDTAAETGP